MNMKNLQYLSFFSLALLACESQNSAHKTKETEIVENHQSVETPKKDSLLSLEFEYMDTTVRPQDDFYEFACGNWLKNNPIPEEESRWSSFNVLSDSNNNVLHKLLEKSASTPAESGSASQLIGDYYATFMDTVRRNEQGIKLLEPELEHIDKIQNEEQLIKVLAHLHDIDVNAFHQIYVGIDAMVNTKYRVHIWQGGLGLPNKDYYFKDDERSKKVRNAYQEYISTLFSKFDLPGSTKKPNDQIAYYIETKLAEVSKGPVELRDPIANYNKTASGLFNASYPHLHWDMYLKERGLTNVDSVIIGQPLFIGGLDKLLETESLEDLKIYLKWRLISSFATALTTDLDREHFKFYSGVLRGTKKQKPLWKRGIASVTNSSIGEALGEAFVKDNFSEDAKRKITEMVENITLVFNERIEDLDWMSPETKVKAKEKLGTFVRKLGFPDEWKDYSSLTINRDSYFGNVVNARRFGVAENLNKLGKEIDRNEWGMVPHIVNAYYNPLLNEIVFPAGIMQKPFFSEHYEDAVNYARMGAVIGHELTHGFDDKGSMYDANGKLNNWWTPEDKKKFDAKTQKLIDQYNTFEVLEGVFVNGELTLGENIADLGGLTIAYHAFEKAKENNEANNKVIRGYTPEQRFFIAFAHVWKNNIRDNALITRVTTDPHSPGKYRVNGTLSNMPEFFEAFDVKEGDPMRQPADKIAKIW